MHQEGHISKNISAAQIGLDGWEKWKNKNHTDWDGSGNRDESGMMVRGMLMSKIHCTNISKNDFFKEREKT